VYGELVPRKCEVEKGARVVETERSAGRVQLASLLFDPECRPDAGVLADHAARAGDYAIIHQLGDETGWAELLRDGLTFDMRGLRPADPIPAAQIAHRFGLPRDDATLAGCHALTIAPGPHLAGAEHLMPVVRVAAGLVQRLCTLPGLRAVSWRPARTATSPTWFAEATGIWLAGGPFPALALASLAREIDGSVRSEGLSFLIGQEFLLSPRNDGPPDQEARIALRLADWLVAHGHVDAPREVILAGVGPVMLEPSENGMIAARCA
jgi:hypothetical protein